MTRAGLAKVMREAVDKVVGWMKTHLRVGLSAPTVKATTVSGAGAVGSLTVSTGTAATSITSLSRDTASSAGGASIVATGTGMSGVTALTVNGTGATVTATTATTVTFTVPALAVGGPYTVASGAASLASALTILPAPTTIFADADFEDGTDGTWSSSASASVSTDAAYAGTKASKSVTAYDGVPTNTNVHTSQLVKSHGNNPARAEANGVYTRWYLMLPQSTIDGAANGTTGLGQIKLHLYRNVDNTPDVTRKHGIVLVTGSQARGNQLGIFRDWNNGNVSGTQVDGDAFTDGSTGLVFVDGVWNEIQLWHYNDGALGYAKLWVNGKKLVDISHIDIVGGTSLGGSPTGGTGGALATASYESRIAIAYTENSDGPLTVYVDKARCANGYIDP